MHLSVYYAVEIVRSYHCSDEQNTTEMCDKYGTHTCVIIVCLLRNMVLKLFEQQQSIDWYEYVIKLTLLYKSNAKFPGIALCTYRY